MDKETYYKDMNFVFFAQVRMEEEVVLYIPLNPKCLNQFLFGLAFDHRLHLDVGLQA
jgi:hypothetical protein